MSTIAERIGGAPISWGVCEAPNWGHELPPERVLAEMRMFAGKYVEDLLDRYDLRLIGGFLPVPMHSCTGADLDEARAAMDTLVAASADVVVLAARSTDGSYDHKVRLSETEWSALLATLGTLRELARERGLRSTLHPHVGTAIEDRAAVLRLLDASDVPLCLDTGHLLIGGMNPSELVALAADRIAHVHLKDVHSGAAAELAGGVSYIDAVRAGLYTPLGEGELDIAGIVRALEGAGYTGWYVLEQDTALDRAPESGTGPIVDVRRSVEFLSTMDSREVAR